MKIVNTNLESEFSRVVAKLPDSLCCAANLQGIGFCFKDLPVSPCFRTTPEQLPPGIAAGMGALNGLAQSSGICWSGCMTLQLLIGFSMLGRKRGGQAAQQQLVAFVGHPTAVVSFHAGTLQVP